jgi:hypothetical protein
LVNVLVTIIGPEDKQKAPAFRTGAFFRLFGGTLLLQPFGGAG